MTVTVDENTLRQHLVEHYQYAEKLGLNELSSGNLSVRLGEGMLISPSGASADNISIDNIVWVSLAGDWQGDHKPSSEWRMHAGIYQLHEDAHAVVHTHSDNCVAVSCHLKPLPGFHYLVGEFGGSDVPCVPYSTFGTQQLADDASAALTDRSACLLGKHGMISRGKDIRVALDLAHRLEIMCRQYILTCHLGQPELLTEEDWVEFFERMEAVSYGEFI